MKVMILVNTLQSVSNNVYGNHIAFFSHMAKKRPDVEITFYTPQRMTIDMARTMAAKQALSEGCDYLMFLDDDVLAPVDALEKLLAAKKDIIAGLVIIRGFPFNVMAFRDMETTEGKRYLGFFNDLEYEYGIDGEWLKLGTEEEKKIFAAKAGYEVFQWEDVAKFPKRLIELQKCDAVGFSCCLINCDMLKAMEPPYFVTGPYNTEDVYFCLKARDTVRDTEDNPPSIYLHTGVQCGHLMPAEAVEWETRNQFYNWYKPYAELMQQKVPVRDREYLDRALAALGK